MAKSSNEIMKYYMKYFHNVHLMRIDGLSLLDGVDTEFPSSSHFTSSVFEACGHKWKLRVEGFAVDSHISLNVELQDRASRDVYVDLKFLLFKKNEYIPRFEKECSKIFNYLDKWHVEACFIPKKLFFDTTKGYVVNDSAIFGVEITTYLQDFPRPMGTGEHLKLIENLPNNKFTWKITKFSSFVEDTNYSNPFTVGQRKWRIKMHPDRGGHLSLYLVALDYLGNAPKADTLVNYKLRVLDQLHREHAEYEDVDTFGSPGSEHGDDKFMDLEELLDQSNGFLVNDVVYIGVEFKFVSVTHIL